MVSGMLTSFLLQRTFHSPTIFLRLMPPPLVQVGALEDLCNAPPHA
jgi:hypothetical protein